MKAAAMSVWIFINLLCFGMCGYLYLIWSQYWMSLEKQRLFSKSHVTPQKNGISGISYQENFSENMISNTVLNVSLLKVDSVRKRSVVAFKTGQMLQWSNKSYGTQVRPSNNIVVKSRGSPRFPNLHKAILEFDSDKYVCNDLTTLECESKTAEFKELLLKEFHRVLMSDSKVFTSGLESQNPYDVKYDRGYVKQLSRGEILCALGQVAVRTVESEDEPFASLGYSIPKDPLQKHRMFNTCAIVTSAGALLGSRLGEFIDSHDMVLRFNNAPTDNYTEDVGSKTTFRILNSQVATKPEFKFLSNPMYKNISIIIWDPANYSSPLDEWYRHPDFPVFRVYKKLLEAQPGADVHLLYPQVLWDLWTVLQDSSPYRLRRNPPSSGFIGLWFAVHRCNRIRMFEYVPSVHATRRCHYHASGDDTGCTLGAWHPLAQEKALAHRMSDNADLDVFQRGFIDVPGIKAVHC
ncbi:beta-galactoside alpha-2,6-sialyltransferase 2 isoform X1 [Nymphalis io]|uniref:beta-galactoside alpha-2,6-sialyltransferase 2 isoform X1 n=1 Tax=Inachis io TaxID=171585 RepID=UPI002169DF2E|nr:beta-galactoside alpha-2,6-sialyltransferase 2 isoform X1 [Nymphalis io]